MNSSHIIVTIEVDDATPIERDDVDRLLEELEPFSPALSTSARGYRTATITVPAGTLRQATAAALAIVEGAFGATALACDAITEAEFDIRQGWQPVPDLLSVAEAAEHLGVSRQRVQQLINEHTLPGTKVGTGYVLPRSAVEARAAGVAGAHPR